MHDTFFNSEMINALIYIAAAFAVLFLKSFLSYTKPGKGITPLQNVILTIIRKVIDNISPEELGRKAALKVNPNSPDARRISADKVFDKNDAIRFNVAIEEAKTRNSADPKRNWDFV